MAERTRPTGRERRIKKKKTRRNFAFVLIAAFVLCVLFGLLRGLGDRLDTMIVRRGEEEESIMTEGYIFREQTLIKSPEAGYLRCEAKEEQRVKAGETVAYIYRKEVNASINSELKAIEAEISRLSSGTKKSDIYSSDEKKVEQSISRSLRQVPVLSYENKLDEISEIRSDVDALMESQRVIRGESVAEKSENELEKLKKRKAELESEYDIDRTVVGAPVAGAFTSEVDGLEEFLGLENVENITPSFLKELDKKKAKTSSDNKVSQGSPIGKIVNNYKWYVAVIMDVKDAEDLDKGDSVDIRFSGIDIRTVSGTVAAVSPEEKGKVAVVVESNKYVDTIYSTSKVSVELVKHHYEGLKVPAESIRIVDGKTGVYVIRNDKARFFPVKILYNSKKWVILSENMTEGGPTIKIYDELIVDGKNLYDDKVVR